MGRIGVKRMLVGLFKWASILPKANPGDVSAEAEETRLEQAQEVRRARLEYLAELRSGRDAGGGR